MKHFNTSQTKPEFNSLRKLSLIRINDNWGKNPFSYGFVESIFFCYKFQPSKIVNIAFLQWDQQFLEVKKEEKVSHQIEIFGLKFINLPAKIRYHFYSPRNLSHHYAPIREITKLCLDGRIYYDY